MNYCREHRAPSQRFLFLQIGNEKTTDQLVERNLEYLRNERQFRKGGWKRSEKDYKPGVYCLYCIKEDKHHFSLLDELDIELEHLDDAPLLFRQAEEFRINDVWEDLVRQFGESIIGYRDFPASPPVFGELADHVKMDPDITKTLYQKILPAGSELYKHQAEAINSIYRGENVTIVTPTASGKTLAYILPILDALLNDEQATALYLAPLNALVEDQLGVFSSFDETDRDWETEVTRDSIFAYMRRLKIGDRWIKIARYDGGVPDGDRKDIRDSQPNIVITNPEMLHFAILSWSDEKHWQYLLQNLRFVVIDELHTYKGIFGSNFANLMRRLRRLCHHLGASPQFICASATIRNPDELARSLTGEPHTIIDQTQDGAPRKLRRFVLWDSTKTGDAINTDAKNLMQRLVGEHRVKTITFARSIPSVDAIYRYVAGDLRDRYGKDVTLIQEFKRALRTDEKRRIAQDLKNGRLHGVVTTTALKLGIDIGDLSTALIVKYPGSIADVWQQAGRAGRKGEGLIFLMLDQDPLNQYFARNPDDFFEMLPEEVYVDPDNKYILMDQLWCATKDREIDLEVDKKFFGESLPEYLDMLHTEGKLLREAARNVWILRDRNGFPAAEVPIRAVGFSIDVIDDKGDKIAQEDTSRATRYLHKYARYTIQDDIYEVTQFHIDLRRKVGDVRVRKLSRPVDYITSSVSRSSSSVIRGKLKRSSFSTQLSYGDIEFRDQVWAYYKMPLGGRDRQAHTQFQPLGPAAPPERVFETTSVWLTLPPNLRKKFNEKEFQAGLHSMAEAIKTAVTIQEFCDPADVDAIELTDHPDTGQPTIFIHDTVPGGIGIAEQVYYDFENVFRRGYRILKECPNAIKAPDHLGCPLCVSEAWGDDESEVVNRPVAIKIMEELLLGDPILERKSDADIESILFRNGFKDLQFVKSGGMGKIYRGRLSGKDLAIKVINPNTLGLSKEMVNRLIKEASIWKRLIHQNIVRLKEVDEREGLLYLTMDYMPRGSLRDRIPADGMEEKEAKRIIQGIARALSYLEEKACVHRDIKPENVLFDIADQPRLTDFGIAKSIDNDYWQQTRAGAAIGTMGYQSPEQVRDASTTTAAADVFSLGIVFYELLTGKLPERNTIGEVVDDAIFHPKIVNHRVLIQKMLLSKVEARPNSIEVVKILETT